MAGKQDEAFVTEITKQSVDFSKWYLDVVRKEFPHGEVTVKAVEGGLKVPDRDTLIATASIQVSGRFPD